MEVARGGILRGWLIIQRKGNDHHPKQRLNITDGRNR
jgi:hypothetical protein